MPIHEVNTPDGGILKVDAPEGASDDQILAFAQQEYYLSQMRPKPKAPEPEAKKERSWTEALVTDPFASLTSGVGALAQLPGQIGQLAGVVQREDTSTGLMGAGKDIQAWAEKQKSETLKQKQAQLQADIGKQEGFFNEAATAIKGTLTDIPLLTSFLFEQVPNLIGGLGGGMVAKGAVKTLLADATETALQKAAVRGAVGTSAVQQGADVGSNTYEQTYEALIAKGLSQEEANRKALTAGREAALGAATASLGAQFLIPGGQTLEKAFLGRDLPEKFLGKTLSKTGVLGAALAGEGTSEAFEEGAGQFISNLTQSQYLPETDLMKGVGSAAGLGGVLGGIMGGAGGVSLQGRQQAALEREAAAENAPPTPAADVAAQAEQARIDAVQAEIAQRRAEMGAPPTETLEQRLAGYEAPPEQLSPLEKAAAESERRQAAAASATQLQAPPEEIYAAVENAARSVEQAGGVATPAQAQLLDQYFPNQRLYDRIEGAETAAPSPIIMPEGRAPRETVRFGEQPSESKEAWEKLTADRQQREAALPTEVQAESPVRPEPQAVLEAINTPAFQQTPEQRLTLQSAEKTYTPEELQLIQTPAFMQTAEQKVQLRGIQRNLDETVKQADQGNPQAKMQLREAGAEFAPEAQKSAEAIRAELTPFLDKIGLGNVGLQLVNSINNGTADGAYFRNVIQIALDAKNPLATLRHETIHALKELGVFTKQEWNYLSKMAKEQWIDQFISKDKQAQYREQYRKDNGSEEGFDAYLQEEAIAEAFRAFGDKPKAGILKRIVNKLKAFFDATGNWFRGNGFNSIDSIFSGVEAGRYGPSRAAEQMAAQPAYNMRPNTIMVDGVERSAVNSNGQRIHPTEEGVRNFWRWFGDSKVVDAEGRPMVVYHGTGGSFDSFDPAKVGQGDYGTAGRGFYFSDSPALASGYSDFSSEQTSGKNVMPVYLKIENPYVGEIPVSVGIKQNSTAFTENIKDNGFDGIFLNGEMTEIVAFSPEQIKSATGNVGAFSPASKDIRYSLTNAPPDAKTTKTEKVKSITQTATEAVNAVMTPSTRSAGWTKIRNRIFDTSAALSKRLGEGGLDRFVDGKLRADLINHAKMQVINLMRNMTKIGLPMLNADGTVGIERSEKTLARAQEIADALDANPEVRASGLSGRDFVAKVAYEKRAEEIRKDDARRNAKGRQMLIEAKEKAAQAKKLAGGNPKEYHDLMTQAAKLQKAGNKEAANEVRKQARNAARGNLTAYRALMKEIRDLRREGYQEKNLKREYRSTPELLAWANKQIANVPELNQIFDIWRTNNHAAIDLQQAVGLLSKQTADEYKRHEHYIPLFKSSEDLDAEKVFGGRGGQGAKSIGKRHELEGGTHEVNVWENVHKQMARMVSTAYENQARRIAAEQLIGVGAAKEVSKSNPHANLVFKRDGKDVAMIVEDDLIVDAFRAMPQTVNPVLKMMGKLTTGFRYGALLNPMFWIKQLLRDPIHSSMVTQTTTTPFHSMKNFAEIVLGRESDAYKNLVEHGVIGEVGSTLSIDDYLKNVGKSESKRQSVGRKILHKALQVHESSDAATRVAIYEAALKKAKANGMSDVDAKNYAVMATRESINFAVQGNSQLLAGLRPLIPFLSASLASLDTVYKAASGYGLNAEEKKQVQKLFIRKAAIFSSFVVAYALMLQDDDDYKSIPDNIRDSNFLLPVPSPTDPTKRVFVKIPIPFEIGFWLKTLPEVSIRYLTGNSTGGEFSDSFWHGFQKTLPGEGNIIPQVVKPIVENVTNHSFFTGKPIVSQGEQRLPVEARGAGSSEAAKMFGGAMGVSPQMIDNLISGYFAELGTSSAAIASSLISKATGVEPPATNFESQWFVKSFVTNPNINKAIGDFYNIDSEAQKAVNYFNELKKTGDVQALEKFVQNEDNIIKMGAQKALSKIGDTMGKLRAQIRFIEKNQDMSPEERRQLINQLQKQQAEIAAVGVDIAKQLGAR